MNGISLMMPWGTYELQGTSAAFVKVSFLCRWTVITVLKAFFATVSQLWAVGVRDETDGKSH